MTPPSLPVWIIEAEQTMTRRSLNLTEPLYTYLCEASVREPPVFARLSETA
jgi:hypothetical protein